MTKSADSEVMSTTIAGEDGQTTFVYMATFDHDPTDAELRSLRPKAYQ